MEFRSTDVPVRRAAVLRTLLLPYRTVQLLYRDTDASVAAHLSIALVQLMTLPLRLLQDIARPVPGLTLLVDAVASVSERAAHCALNVPLTAVTAPVRILSDVLRCDEAPHTAALLLAIGCFFLQAAYEVGTLIVDVATDVFWLLALQRSQRLAAMWTGFAADHAPVVTAAPPDTRDEFMWARVFVFDATEYRKNFFLGLSWKGAPFAFPRDRFTHSIGVRTWRECFDRLTAIARVRKIVEVQFAGHGCPGAAFIDGVGFTVTSMQRESWFADFVAATPFPTGVPPLFWFRTCSTLQGDAGRDFARELSGAFRRSNPAVRLRVAGHTQNIATPNPFLAPGLMCYSAPPAGEEDAAPWADDAGVTIASVIWSPNVLMPIYCA